MNIIVFNNLSQMICLKVPNFQGLVAIFFSNFPGRGHNSTEVNHPTYLRSFVVPIQRTGSIPKYPSEMVDRRGGGVKGLTSYIRTSHPVTL